MSDKAEKDFETLPPGILLVCPKADSCPYLGPAYACSHSSHHHLLQGCDAENNLCPKCQPANIVTISQEEEFPADVRELPDRWLNP